MSIFLYGTATNTGKDFFTRQNRLDFFLRGYPADVWVVGYNTEGGLWLSEKNAVQKTKAEAQAIVDAQITADQAEWDALPEAEKTDMNPRPTDITLP